MKIDEHLLHLIERHFLTEGSYRSAMRVTASIVQGSNIGTAEGDTVLITRAEGIAAYNAHMRTIIIDEVLTDLEQIEK